MSDQEHVHHLLRTALRCEKRLASISRWVRFFGIVGLLGFVAALMIVTAAGGFGVLAAASAAG